MHEVPRRPLLRGVTTMVATGATIVARLATLLRSATSQGAARLATGRGATRPTTSQGVVRPTASRGAARPSLRRSWKKTRRWLYSRNTAPESGSIINVFVLLFYGRA
jgi:hypothetical protein